MAKMVNPPNDDFPTELVGHLSLAGHFGIDVPDDKDSEKLKLIWEKTKDDPMKLARLEGKLGSPGIGQARLDQIYRWLKLRS